MKVYEGKKLQELVAQYAHALQVCGVNVEQVWLHGAYVTGWPTKFDFVELAITSPEFKEVGMVDILQKLLIALEMMPQPCQIRPTAWHAGDMTMPVNEIRQSGRLVWDARKVLA